ncbi:MAG: Na/Pi cotransporter family protein [Pseudomonadota bacterium]
MHIAGAVCLLLWGTRMVKIGFTRAYGTSLRKAIKQGTQNRFTACGAGIVVTTMLQSSTATALLLISFVKNNTVPLTAALAVIIGSDIATTLVAQILVFDISFLSPALLIIGIAGHMKFEHGGRKRHIFRVFIGLGLMLLSLSLIKQASAPLSTSATLPLILGPLENDPLTAIIFAAILTWVMHSSLAAVLLFATLATNNILDLELGALMILGANLGGAFIAFIATYKDGVPARRITLGNIIMRCFTVILFFLFIDLAIHQLTRYDFDTARHLINLHTAFNVVLALIFLPSVQWIAPLCKKLVPDKKNVEAPAYEPVYLDDKALNSPVVALACSARETLRMADMVQEMLEDTIDAFKENDNRLANKISQSDDTVDRLYGKIKLYMTQLTQEALDPKESDRYLQILNFATNLEHIGDIIDKSLMELAKKKIKKKERFSDEGWDEITNFHEQIVENMRSAQTIFLSEDPNLAQQLVDQKKEIGHAARASSEMHFDRLREGLPETIATSSLHLDIIRDYRRINSYITTVAYAILENAKKHKSKRRKHDKN